MHSASAGIGVRVFNAPIRRYCPRVFIVCTQQFTTPGAPTEPCWMPEASVDCGCGCGSPNCKLNSRAAIVGCERTKADSQIKGSNEREAGEYGSFLIRYLLISPPA